jgi:exodeoxyribonuclease VII small subunit
LTPRKTPASGGAAESAKEPVRYADLMEELERILEDLENDAIDVDELAARVKRASELIRICRERLAYSKAEIEQVVAELQTLDTGSEDDTGESDEDPF